MEAVSDALFKFFDLLTVGDLRQLEKLISEQNYRKALLELTRNVTPRGKRIKEIGIYRRHYEKVQSVYLTDALPPRIRKVIPQRSLNLLISKRSKFVGYSVRFT